MLFLAGCADVSPQPGSLLDMRQQAELQLARTCYKELSMANPWKTTYYNVGGGVLVDERTYCRVMAHQAINARSKAIKSSLATNRRQ